MALSPMEPNAMTRGGQNPCFRVSERVYVVPAAPGEAFDLARRVGVGIRELA